MNQLHWTETVNQPGQPVATGTLSDQHVRSLLARATRHGYQVRCTTNGTFTIRRLVSRGHLTVTLTPPRPTNASERQVKDVQLVLNGSRAYRDTDDSIGIGFARIPPAAARRLLTNGLLDQNDASRITVTVAGITALTLHEHRARTTEPRGYYYPSDDPRTIGRIGPDRHGGKLHDRTSIAVCSCRWSTFCDDRPAAAAAAGIHRADVILHAAGITDRQEAAL